MSQTSIFLTVRAITLETPDTISIQFEQPWVKPVQYRPGQFLTVIATVNGNKIRRAYSLCSSPHTDAFPAISVKRIPDGLMTNYLFDNLKVGSSLEVLEPLGNFVFEPKPAAKRHIVLFGAGSGITPLFSIIKSALKAEPDALVSLVYGNRYQNTIIFYDELKGLQEKYPSRFKVLHCLSAPPNVWYGASGRLNPELVNEVLDQWQPISPVQETLYYMCGPQEMMDTIAKTLEDRKVLKPFIFRESFFSSISEAAAQTIVEEEGIVTRKIKVIYDGDEFVFDVEPKNTILEAAQDKDINLPYSCQSGLCTACRGKCLSGKVHLIEREGLSDSEFNEGYILTCVAHPLTDDVVIEIG
jgi:ring-1,2-phenylacetyl-CoA epoxidase subunit PaaE